MKPGPGSPLLARARSGAWHPCTLREGPRPVSPRRLRTPRPAPPAPAPIPVLSLRRARDESVSPDGNIASCRSPSKATAVASRAFYSPPLSKIVSGPKSTVLERELGLSVSERGQPRARRLVLRDDSAAFSPAARRPAPFLRPLCLPHAKHLSHLRPGLAVLTGMPRTYGSFRHKHSSFLVTAVGSTQHVITL